MHECSAVDLQGVDPSLRPSAWPFLLRVFPADSTDAERQVLLAGMGVAFESLLDQAKVLSHRELSYTDRSRSCQPK